MSKLWEKWCDKQVEQVAIGIRDDWKRFADTGNCVYIESCDDCPFAVTVDGKFMCADKSLEGRKAKLNEEER